LAGDPDNDVVLVVQRGNPAASPVEPAAPSGIAVKLRSFLVPAGAATTSRCTVYASAKPSTPYSGRLGVLVSKRDTSSDSGSTAWMTVCTGGFTLPEARMARVSLITTLQGVKAGSGTAVANGSCYIRVMDNATQLVWMERQLNNTAASQQYSDLYRLAAGSHTISLQISDGVSGWKRLYAASSWPGQALNVTDDGPAL
jgi:hypothetical protein